MHSVLVEQVKCIFQDMTDNPTAVMRAVDELINHIMQSALLESDMALCFSRGYGCDHDVYTHAMNVALLSMLIAKEMGFSEQQIKYAGIGALFHDVAHHDALQCAKEKSEASSPTPEDTMRRHCRQGVDICNRLQLPYESILIVWQHHELADGTGYPEQLKGTKISPLAKIVAVVNAFDEICYPLDRTYKLTPHEALSKIYAQQRDQFDEKVLQALVRCLGVYPLGTIVALSNSAIGVVKTVNKNHSLKPIVQVYDPMNSKGNVGLLDLEQEKSVSIVRHIPPHQLAPEVVQFLGGVESLPQQGVAKGDFPLSRKRERGRGEGL